MQDQEENQQNQDTAQDEVRDEQVNPQDDQAQSDQSDQPSDSDNLHDMYDRHEGDMGGNEAGEADVPQDERGDSEAVNADESQARDEQSSGDTASQEAVQPSADAAGKKILLVEDDVALAAVYRSRLELEGFEIHEVHNGEEALQTAKELQPDLVLLDAMMPKISGFDVLDILRHTPETANIRVIMLTALSQPKDKEKAESLGVDDYLVKSQVVIGDVVERVKHHLGMSS